MRRQGWGSARKEAYGDRVYHSHSEAEYARHLDRLLKRKQIVAWQPQVRIPLDVHGKHVCTMVVDFAVDALDGETVYVEIKGHETAVWRLKKRLLDALHPNHRYVVIKAKDVLNGTATQGLPAQSARTRRRRVAGRALRQRVRR